MGGGVGRVARVGMSIRWTEQILQLFQTKTYVVHNNIGMGHNSIANSNEPMLRTPFCILDLMPRKDGLIAESTSQVAAKPNKLDLNNRIAKACQRGQRVSAARNQDKRAVVLATTGVQRIGTTFKTAS